jgi:hypothetical protein
MENIARSRILAIQIDDIFDCDVVVISLEHCVAGMNRSRACGGFIMNRKTGTNSLTYASVETLKTNPIGGFFQSLFCPTICLGRFLNKGFYDG